MITLVPSSIEQESLKGDHISRDCKETNLLTVMSCIQEILQKTYAISYFSDQSCLTIPLTPTTSVVLGLMMPPISMTPNLVLQLQCLTLANLNVWVETHEPSCNIWQAMTGVWSGHRPPHERGPFMELKKTDLVSV